VVENNAGYRQAKAVARTGRVGIAGTVWQAGNRNGGSTVAGQACGGIRSEREEPVYGSNKTACSRTTAWQSKVTMPRYA
jgi:hypothetical protein